MSVEHEHRGAVPARRLIAFIPFPTRELAARLPDEEAQPATLAYGVTLVVSAILFQAIWSWGENTLLVRT